MLLGFDPLELSEHEVAQHTPESGRRDKQPLRYQMNFMRSRAQKVAGSLLP